MKSTLIFFLALISFYCFCQNPVRAPRKNGFYSKDRWGITRVSGKCENHMKVGRWEYRNNRGYLFKAELFDQHGMLLTTQKYFYDLKKNCCDMYSYVDSLKNGKYIHTTLYARQPYSPTSDSLVTGWYLNNRKNGEWNFYRKIADEENLWKKENWKNDTLVSTNVYTTGGELFSVTVTDSITKESKTDYYYEKKFIGSEFSGSKDSLTAIHGFDFSSEEFYDENLFYRFFHDNISYPPMALDSNIEGTVFVSFEINKFGAIKNISVLNHRDATIDLENEAVRVLEMMPPFEPVADRKNVTMNLPVKFDLQ